MHVLIFEPAHGGHHFVYLRHYLAGLADTPARITLVTHDQATATTEYASLLADRAAHFDLDDVLNPPSGSPLHKARQRAAWLQQAVDRHRPDHVWMPYADGLAPLLSLTGRPRPGPAHRLRSETVFHHSRFAYHNTTFKQRAITRLTAALLCRSRIDRFHFVDHLEFEHLQQCRRRLAQKSALLPDPVEVPAATTSAAAAGHLDLDPDADYLGCVGQISPRKGVDRLVQAFAEAPLPDRCRLLLVGRHDPAIHQTIARLTEPLRRRIVSIDRFVSLDQLTLALQAMRVVVVLQGGHVGISSIVLRAAAAQRFVLCHDAGWPGWIVPRFGLGGLVPLGDVSTTAAGLARAWTDAQAWQPGPAAQRLIQFHHPQNFTATLTNPLRQQMNLPPLPLLPWAEVRHAALPPPSGPAPQPAPRR